MYRMLKRRSGGRIATVLVALLCVVYLVCYASVGFAASGPHKPGTLEVSAVKGEFKQIQMADEKNSSISCKGNTVTINVDGMSCPGANAVAHITAKNTGTLNATLVSVDFNEPDVSYIKGRIADIPIGEVLKPGDECNFDIAVYWDAKADLPPVVNDKASFKAVLVYENNEYLPPPDDDPSPKTGDDSNMELFTWIAIICGIVLVICLIFMIIGKKKKKEDDDDAE